MSREVIPKYNNHYKCPRCNSEWWDAWDCQVDDDCPYCGKRHITPFESEDLVSGEVEEC